MPSHPVLSHGTRTTYNHITVVRRRSGLAWLLSTSAVSYSPGSTLTPHGSTKRPRSTCHFLSLLLWHPPVSSSISAAAMRKGAGWFRVVCNWVGRAKGMEVGTHPRSGGGLETVIPDLSTQCRLENFS